MNEHLHNLIESLREELKHYGELLALLDLEQGCIVRRRPEELLDTVSDINTQGDLIQVARREREQRQRELARSLQVAEDAPLGSLLPALPEPYRPLVSALVGENNQLLMRVRQRARQNHLLLNRSVELMERFIGSFCGVGAPVYNESGTMKPPKAVSHAFYEAVG
jgi:flagellar biosynthesis/type III secretory pathway chaperone